VNIRRPPKRFDSPLNRSFADAENILEGYNYTVFLFHYFSPEPQVGLQAHLAAVLPTTDVEIGKSSEILPAEALAEITEALEHRGDAAYGPIPEKVDSDRYRDLVAKALRETQELFSSADRLEVFWLKSGHPAYPVFWDFAFAAFTVDGVHVIMGSSSD
jgi:hypothetical protein